MVEGRENSASLIEAVWVSLEDTHHNTQAVCTGQSAARTG